MKKVVFSIVFLLSWFSGFSQSVTNVSSGVKYPRNITPYAIIDFQHGDTLSWYWNKSETKSYITGLGLATTSSVNSKLPITVYTNSVTPLYHISAPVYSICVTKDTGIYIKVLGIDSSGWFKDR